MTLKSDKYKKLVSEALKKECINCNVSYNENDTNAQLCEKINNH